MTHTNSIIQPVVQHLEEGFQPYFNSSTDWQAEGQLVLKQLLKTWPELQQDPVRLRLLFRTSFIRHISQFALD